MVKVINEISIKTFRNFQVYSGHHTSATRQIFGEEECDAVLLVEVTNAPKYSN